MNDPRGLCRPECEDNPACRASCADYEAEKATERKRRHERYERERAADEEALRHP